MKHKYGFINLKYLSVVGVGTYKYLLKEEKTKTTTANKLAELI